MSQEFCSICKQFIPVVDLDETAMDDHINKEHSDEVHSEEGYIQFAEDHVIDHEQGLEALALEALQLDQEIHEVKKAMAKDEKIKQLSLKISELEKAQEDADLMISQLMNPYHDKTRLLDDQKVRLLHELKQQHDPEHKVKDFEKARIEWKESRSLKILDTVRAVEILTANKKLEDGIGSFKIPFMRKLKDVGLLEDAVAAYDSKINVYVRAKEPAYNHPCPKCGKNDPKNWTAPNTSGIVYCVNCGYQTTLKELKPEG